jgi:hypothetical protein
VPATIDLAALLRTDGSAATIEGVEELAASYGVSSVVTPEEFVDERSDLLRGFQRVVQWMLLFTLLQALVGVVNTLVLSVAERRREFGLLRVSGASRKQVLRMVLFEGTSLSVVGTVLGVAMGIAGAAFAVRALSGLGLDTFSVPVPTVVAIAAAALVVGVVAAWLPARVAAAIPPLEAALDSGVEVARRGARTVRPVVQPRPAMQSEPGGAPVVTAAAGVPPPNAQEIAALLRLYGLGEKRPGPEPVAPDTSAPATSVPTPGLARVAAAPAATAAPEPATATSVNPQTTPIPPAPQPPTTQVSPAVQTPAVPVPEAPVPAPPRDAPAVPPPFLPPAAPSPQVGGPVTPPAPARPAAGGDVPVGDVSAGQEGTAGAGPNPTPEGRGEGRRAKIAAAARRLPRRRPRRTETAATDAAEGWVNPNAVRTAPADAAPATPGPGVPRAAAGDAERRAAELSDRTRLLDQDSVHRSSRALTGMGESLAEGEHLGALVVGRVKSWPAALGRTDRRLLLVVDRSERLAVESLHPHATTVMVRPGVSGTVTVVLVDRERLLELAEVVDSRAAESLMAREALTT